MKFSSVIGHTAVKQRLVNMAKEGRVSHALLFLGNEGSGDLALALAFAQYLMCENATEDACGTCAACLKMEKLAHPDVSFSFPVAPKEKISKPKSLDFIAPWRAAVIDNPYLSYNDWMESLSLDNKQGIISVEESGDIVQRLSLRSVEGGFKIVLMWLPERMNIPAANKLLKIIEEPPAKTLFFMVTENYELLPTTILSRTQLVKLNRITDDEMHHALTARGTDPLASRRIVHRSDGNYNEALRIVESEGDDDFAQKFLQWMRACLKLNLEGITQLTQEFAGESRESQKNFIRNALVIVRECMLINYGDRSLVRLNEKDFDDISRFAPFVNKANLEEFAAELNQAHFHLERNANSRILFTDLSFAMHKLLGKKAEAV